MAYKIITLGRQFGSGGREIGKRLADEIGYAFYDKELIAKTAEKSGMNQAFLEQNDENIKGSFFQNFTLGLYNAANTFSEMSEISINDRTFMVQAEIIKEISQKENAVIVGRCADYVLSDLPECYHVFVHAEMDKRIQRASEQYGMKDQNLKEIITKIDRRRANYYNYYTGKKWGKAMTYHVSLDSGILGIEKCVAMLKEMMQ